MTSLRPESMTWFMLAMDAVAHQLLDDVNWGLIQHLGEILDRHGGGQNQRTVLLTAAPFATFSSGPLFSGLLVNCGSSCITSHLSLTCQTSYIGGPISLNCLSAEGPENFRGIGAEGGQVISRKRPAQAAGQSAATQGRFPALGAADIGTASGRLASGVNGHLALRRTGHPNQFPLGLLATAGNASTFGDMPLSGQFPVLPAD